MSHLEKSNDFQSLATTIQTQLQKSKDAIEHFIEEEKKKAYWTIGKELSLYLMKNPTSKGKLFEALESELTLPRTGFYKALQCYETYPKSVPAPAQISWTHITSLITIDNKKERDALEKRIVKENLSTRDTQELAKKVQALPSKKATKTLTPKREAPYIYATKTFEHGTYLDLGFNVNIPLPKGFKDGANDTHYTYKAKLLEVVDGDTIWVHVDLGFNTFTTQKLRFRGLDTPPLSEKKGLDAKAYVEKQLKPCSFIVIHTYWRDKFDRYLVDIFYSRKLKTVEEVVAKGDYLNQELLDLGLATGT